MLELAPGSPWYAILEAMIRMVSRPGASSQLLRRNAQPEVLPGQEGDAVIQLQGCFGEKVDGGRGEPAERFCRDGLGGVAEVGQDQDDGAALRRTRTLVAEHCAVVGAEIDQRGPRQPGGAGPDLDHPLQ